MDKNEGKVVYYNTSKIIIPNKGVKVEFLESTRNPIYLARVSMITTFDNVLVVY